MPRFCDIVMKGGITSGIVYPAAVFEIARTFVFKNVGGTSAGAIAAALTAAAERRRALDGSMDGFVRLGDVPKYLAQNNRLARLFTPNRSTRALYGVVAGIFGRPRFRPAWLAKWCALVWAYPVACGVGALLGALFLTAVLRAPGTRLNLIINLLGAILTIIVGMTIAIGVAFASDLLKRLPKNAYGLVTGVDDNDRKSLSALCTWLTNELELTAGLDAGKIPLTFGMLWDAKRDAALPALEERPADPDVNLEMITTNVTWGRPYNFPFNAVFYYDPLELHAFFPDHVIAWMKQHPRPPRDAEESAHFELHAQAGKLPLPPVADLPVIVATRMSLAFPILLSAVPLYATDFSNPAPDGGIPKLEQCWFSDGGISSNFPITLFDSPLPRWPTFAINLAPFQPAHPQQSDEAKNVYLPSSTGAGRLPSFSRFTTLPDFVLSIFNAMQNWSDTTQSRLPGYRDRIVTVFLSKEEGGLNLDMPARVLERLRLRGAAAGALIAGRFAEPSLLSDHAGGMNWEVHRWLRLRSTLGSLRAYFWAFARGFQDPQPPDVSYSDLILANDGIPRHRYPLAAKQRTFVDHATKHIAGLGHEIAALETLDDDLPKPVPKLVTRPSLDT